MKEFEVALRAELTRINKLRADIIESEKHNFQPGSNPDLWKHTDGKYVLMPLIEARSLLLNAIALERSGGKK